jgi:hypothetical protein
MKLTEWTTPGSEEVYDFDHDKYSGWAYRDDRKDVWRVVISGIDGAFREVNVAFKRGRTLRFAIRDAIKAYPERPAPRTDARTGRKNYGDFVSLM